MTVLLHPLFRLPLPYRVRQFLLAALAPVAEAEVEQALALAALPAPAAQLFRTMPRPYRRHALNVAGRLYAEGQTDRQLLQAALLHDMGKWHPPSGRRVGLLVRVANTLLRRVSPGRALRRRLAAGPPSPRSWRYPWYLQAAHPRLGARLAHAAGLHPDVVALIAHHEDTAHAPEHLAAKLATLAAADSRE